MKTINKFGLPQYIFNSLTAMILTIVLAIVSIISINSIRSSPIFLFLLTLGIGIASALGLTRGGLFGLFLLSIWIVTKQTIGVWSEDKLYLNLLEISLAAAAFVASGSYHENLRVHFKEFQDDKQKLKLLDLEDASIGLIKPAIGLLRLKEETDRALRYRRQFSLLLILVRPIHGTSWEPGIRLSIMRAIATTIKDTIRAMDIPFLIGPEKIAVILPDTEINGVNKALSNILQKLIATRVINATGVSEALQDHAQIRLGFGAFLGYSKKPIDLMEAAEKSLQKNIETNIGNIFQNLFIDWEIVGDPVSLNTVISLDTREIFEQVDHGIGAEHNWRKK